ncbi:MAG: twin-arginine translocase TatA/TatE family subunit [Dehalococcoidia bacterium]|nr:twin-arginine translocase TatA/TatE family subunit [Dehalococcoidia bacterium]
MFGKIGAPQIALILILFIMIFGLGKLPQVGASIGKSIRAFKKSQEEDTEEEEVTPTKKRKVAKKKVKDEEEF